MEQQETQNKEQTISKLYALRAGLSVMSQENDRVQKLYGDAEYSAYKAATNASTSASYSVYKSAFRETPRDVIDKKDVSDCTELKPFIDKITSGKLTEICRQDIASNEQYIEPNKRKQRLFRTLFRLCLLVIVVSIVMCALFATVLDNTLLAYALFVPLAIASAIGAFFLKIAVNEEEGSLEATMRVISEDKATIEKANQATQKIAALRKQAKEEILPVQKTSEQFFQGMQQEFSSLLDERDWENVDLVIFYLETGRADTVKEALLLVDKELQTQRIVDAIQQASYQICRTIERGFEALQNTVKECFTTLSAQIAVQNKQLEQLTQAVRLNNALREKANVTSAQLASDVRQVREFVYR